MNSVTEIDSGQPYNDTYNLSDNFDRYLWRPGHPLLQSEMNGFQSARLTQEKILADQYFPNGTVLEGMNIQPVSNNKGSATNNDNANPNLFTYSNLHILPGGSVQSNTDTYTGNGEIDYDSNATDESDQLGFDVTYNQPSDSKNSTLSFEIAQAGTEGSPLENIAVLPTGGSQIQEVTIDGNVVTTPLDNDAGDNLVGTDPHNIDLTDGNFHQVTVIFDNSNVGSNSRNKNVEFKLLFNNGFSAVNNQLDVTLTHFKVEKGTEVTPWKPSADDSTKPTTGDRKNAVLVSNGYLYLDGQVRHFTKQTINMVGIGAEKIGVKLIHNVVTADTDHQLVDDTPGASSNGEAGADREHYTIQLTYGNEPADAIIYYFQDGKKIADADSHQFDKLNNVLATRTYEQAGSFLSYGMNMEPYPNQDNSKLINIQFTPGVAYVLGNRVANNGTDMISIPTETRTGYRQGENEPVHKATNGLYDLIYPSLQPLNLSGNSDLGGYYGGISVSGVDDHAHVQVESINGDQTDLTQANDETGPDSPVNTLGPNPQIVDDPSTYAIYNYKPGTVEPSVLWKVPKQNANGEVYHLGNLDGKPTLYIDQDEAFFQHGITDGGSCFIKCHTHRLFVGKNRSYMPANDQNYARGYNGFDYKLDIGTRNEAVAGVNVSAKDVAIDFNAKGATGHVPTTKEPDAEGVYLNYAAYYSREDLITLNPNGTFHDVEGQPGFADEIEPPVNNSNNRNQTLTLGYVHIYPNSQIASAEKSTIPRIPFSGLDNMALQVQSLQENMSILAAREAAMSGIDPSTLKDTFSDFFITHDKADLTREPQFDVNYSPFQWISPGYIAEGNLPIETDGIEDPMSKTITAPHNTKSDPYYLRQTVSTDVLDLNTNGMVTTKGKIVCDPSIFHNHYKKDQPINTYAWKTLSAQKANDEAAKALDKQKTGLQTNGGNVEINDMNLSHQEAEQLAQKNYLSNTYKTFKHVTPTTSYAQQGFMAPQWIHIQGSGFTPNTDNLSVTILSNNDQHIPVATDPSTLTDDGYIYNNSGDQIGHTYGYDNYNHYSAGIPGSQPGTVKADGDGNVSCWFRIPNRSVPAHLQTIQLANASGNWGLTYIDGTLQEIIHHNTIDDLYINSSTLNAVEEAKQAAKNHQFDESLLQVDGHLHNIDKFDNQAYNDIHRLNSNMNSYAVKFTDTINYNTASLSEGTSELSDTVTILDALQQQEDSILTSNISNVRSAMVSATTSNAAHIASLASTTASQFDNVYSSMSSADSVYDDEIASLATMTSDNSEANEILSGDLTTDVGSLNAQIAVNAYEASESAAAANAAAAAAAESAEAAQNTANTADYNANNAQNTANTADNSANYANIASYGNDNHDLADHEADNPSTRVSHWITDMMFSWGALGSLGTETAYADGNSDWPGATNAAYNAATSQGGIWLVASPGDPGTSGTPTEVVPPDTNAGEFNGQSMSYQDVKQHIIAYVQQNVSY